MAYLLLGFVLAVVVAVFALQNASPVSIRFLAWQLPQVGLALVVLLAALAGALLGILLGASQVIRERRRHAQQISQMTEAAPAGASEAPGAPSPQPEAPPLPQAPPEPGAVAPPPDPSASAPAPPPPPDGEADEGAPASEDPAAREDD